MASASAVPVSGPQLDNRRVLAALIDLVVVGVGAALIQAAAGVLGDSPSEIGAPLIAVTLAWALYYYFACESSESGQTLGKRAMKIRVVRMDGAPADMRDIAVRTVVRVVDMQFAYLVGLIVMLATGERRGRLGDLAAKTKIVAADAPAAAPAAPAPVEEPTAPRVPIAESGPAFADAELEEPEAEAEPSEEETVDLSSPSLKELAADVEATAGSAPDEEEEPVAEEAEEPTASEPAAEEPAAEEAAAEEAAAEEAELDEDLVDQDPLADADAQDPEPEVEGDEELPPAAEAEDEDEVKRIETISAIDLVMEDSKRDS